MQHQRYQSEFDRINRHENPLDMQRYHVDPPPPEKRQDLMAWSKAVENAEVALEHQNKRSFLFLFFTAPSSPDRRLMNLFLATKYGPKKAAHYEMEMQAREDRFVGFLAPRPRHAMCHFFPSSIQSSNSFPSPPHPPSIPRSLSKELADLKEEIVRINRERKKSQVSSRPSSVPLRCRSRTPFWRYWVPLSIKEEV